MSAIRRLLQSKDPLFRVATGVIVFAAGAFALAEQNDYGGVVVLGVVVLVLISRNLKALTRGKPTDQAVVSWVTQRRRENRSAGPER